jgi:hypothetical protein
MLFLLFVLATDNIVTGPVAPPPCEMPCVFEVWERQRWEV